VSAERLTSESSPSMLEVTLAPPSWKTSKSANWAGREVSKRAEEKRQLGAHLRVVYLTAAKVDVGEGGHVVPLSEKRLKSA
jgi:hypothetical protein